MADGKIVQCIGAVVDVEFPRNAMPKVFDALKMEGSELTLEVQQQLGDGIVRTIALGSSEGLRRGMLIQNTGKPIMVPVGKATLGRIMDVLGNPIDELLVRYLEALIYQAVAENLASEQSARMVAMKAASDNAGNVIGELKLVYNKTRQAAITKELSEIVSGAAAV